jgi:hypothetical protein
MKIKTLNGLRGAVLTQSFAVGKLLITVKQ